MDNNDKKINDYQEQYDILVEEEQEKQKKKAFWIMFFCLIIILFSVLGATYSYYRVYTTEKSELNIDTNGDGEPDLNVDLNHDGICDINCDIDNDGKPDINIDYKGDLKAHFNLDLDHDGKPDTNMINQNNKNGIACSLKGSCDLNCDTDGDHHPDINIDFDGDGKPDINIDTDCDGKADLNIDIDGDGKPDLNIDTDGDGKPDKFVDTDGDGVCDLNCGNEEPKPEPKPQDPIIEVKPSEPDDKIATLFVSYTQSAIMENMIPSSTITQTFSVENQSDATLVYDLNWKDVYNELTILEGLTYQVKRQTLGSDAISVGELISIPNSDSNMLSKIVIPAHTTYLYEINYTFHDLADKDQTLDQNKTFKAKIMAEQVAIVQ